MHVLAWAEAAHLATLDGPEQPLASTFCTMPWRQSFWRELLAQGIVSWNEWRSANPDIPPAFIDGDLASNRDLQGINLRAAYLAGLDLRGVNFSNGDLSAANFIGANLSRASFRGAKLVGTRLIQADLTEADFENADLESAEVERAIFSATNLRGARNLSTCKYGRSTFDLSTIRVSGPLPKAFLRQRGVVDVVIENMDALFTQPLLFNTCFISYSSLDEEFAAKLDDALRGQKVPTWFAPKDMRIGDRIRQTIDGAIRMRQKLIVVLSKHSVASRWVESEVETALEEERERPTPMLFPIRIDDSVFESKAAWAIEICRRHIGNFAQWKIPREFQAAFKILMRDLRPTDHKRAG